MERFYDSYVDRKDGLFITYRTGTNSYEECLSDGIYYSAGWLGSAYAPQTITISRVPRMDFKSCVRGSAFRLVVDGVECVAGWEFVSHETEEKERGMHVKVCLHNPLHEVDVEVHTLLDGTPILARWLVIRNLRKTRRFISEMQIMSGPMLQTEHTACQLKPGDNLYRLGYMEAHNWGCEGVFKWHEITGDGGYSVSGRFARDRFRHPIFLLENRVTGQTFIGQIAYSGGWKFEFDYRCDVSAWGAGDSFMTFGAGPDGYAPVADVAPLAALETPAMHLGMTYGDHDNAFNAMHDHVRRSVLRHYAPWNAPLEVGLGGEMDMDMPGVLHSIEYCEKYGVEYFIMDHGWQFQPATDTSDHAWIPNTSRYDWGIAKIRDYCREKGIKFGLWMEPERVFDEFEKIKKERPDIFANTYQMAPDVPVSAPHGGPIGLYMKDASEYVFEMMDEIISTYDIDIFRLDHNMFYRSYVMKDGVPVYADMDYFINFYEIMDRLRKKYPKCIFENCASGGGRTDLGMMANADHTWVTDWQKAPRSFVITNGLTMCLPPETVDRIIGAQIGHAYGSFPFQCLQLLFGRPTLNGSTVNGTKESAYMEALLTRVIGVYKNVVQKAGATDMYHHTLEFDTYEPKGTGILERAAKDGSFSLLGIFNLADAGTFEDRICFRGVDIGKTYELTYLTSGQCARVSGFTLAKEGLQVRLCGALNAECILAKAVD